MWNPPERSFLYRCKIARPMAREKTCTVCKASTQREFYPMKEWDVEGPLCGNCYSKRIHDHYPGEHVRVNKDLD